MSVLDLFFPTNCKCMFCNCETPEFGICDNCYSMLPIIKGKTCEKCGGENHGRGAVCIECKNREHDFDKNYCVFHYTGDVRDKIVNFKQGGKKYYGYSFSWLIERKYLEIDENIDIIIPVPINETRLKERGFNQSEVLCEELLLTGKVDLNVLARVKDTPHQTGLNRENREKNLKGSFELLDKKKIKDKNILLVDDIYTTGSTLNECARLLKSKGANKVIGLCLARAVIDKSRIVEVSEKPIKGKDKNPIVYTGY